MLSTGRFLSVLKTSSLSHISNQTWWMSSLAVRLKPPM